jgi:catechol 2,3-dioxygenase-like lactoylglutathione lyase family enzyme
LAWRCRRSRAERARRSPPDATTGLHHVRLAGPIGCEAKARAFYGGLLGSDEIEQQPAMARRGGVWWALGDGRQLHIGADAEFQAGVKAHPAFTPRLTRPDVAAR